MRQFGLSVTPMIPAGCPARNHMMGENVQEVPPLVLLSMR